MDVVYDHFLALDNNEFPEQRLEVFTKETYRQLFEHEAVLPEKFVRMLPYMSSQDWLLHYRFTDGIEKSFGGVVRRAQYLSESQPAFQLFLRHYDQLGKHYNEFFPDIKDFASSQFDALLMQ